MKKSKDKFLPSKIIQDEIFCRSKIQDAKIKVRKIEGEKSKMKKSPEKYVSRNGYQMKLVAVGPLETEEIYTLTNISPSHVVLGGPRLS